MASGANAIVTGQVVSTGQALVVDTIGFTPKRIEFWVGGVKVEWQKTMANASAYKRLANGTGSLITANGITPDSHGFTIGTDSDINPGTATTIDYTVWPE